MAIGLRATLTRWLVSRRVVERLRRQVNSRVAGTRTGEAFQGTPSTPAYTSAGGLLPVLPLFLDKVVSLVLDVFGTMTDGFLWLARALTEGMLTAAANLFMVGISTFLIPQNPRHMEAPNELWLKMLPIAAIFLVLGFLGNLITAQVFASSEKADPRRMLDRMFKATFMIFLSRPFLQFIIEFTNVLTAALLPADYSFQFGTSITEGMVTVLLGKGVFAAFIFSSITIGNLIFTGLLFFLILAFRMLLIYTLYALFPLIVAAWVVDIGPAKYGNMLAKMMFKLTAALLAYGILVAAFLRVGSTLAGNPASSGSYSSDSTSHSIEEFGPGGTFNLAEIDQQTGPGGLTAADASFSTSAGIQGALEQGLVKYVAFFGPIWLCIAAGISLFTVLLTVQPRSNPVRGARKQMQRHGGFGVKRGTLRRLGYTGSATAAGSAGGQPGAMTMEQATGSSTGGSEGAAIPTTDGLKQPSVSLSNPDTLDDPGAIGEDVDQVAPNIARDYTGRLGSDPGPDVDTTIPFGERASEYASRTRSHIEEKAEEGSSVATLADSAFVMGDRVADPLGEYSSQIVSDDRVEAATGMLRKSVGTLSRASKSPTVLGTFATLRHGVREMDTLRPEYPAHRYPGHLTQDDVWGAHPDNVPASLTGVLPHTGNQHVGAAADATQPADLRSNHDIGGVSRLSTTPAVVVATAMDTGADLDSEMMEFQAGPARTTTHEGQIGAFQQSAADDVADTPGGVSQPALVNPASDAGGEHVTLYGQEIGYGETSDGAAGIETVGIAAPAARRSAPELGDRPDPTVTTNSQQATMGPNIAEGPSSQQRQRETQDSPPRADANGHVDAGEDADTRKNAGESEPFPTGGESGSDDPSEDGTSDAEEPGEEASDTDAGTSGEDTTLDAILSGVFTGAASAGAAGEARPEGGTEGAVALSLGLMARGRTPAGDDEEDFLEAVEQRVERETGVDPDDASFEDVEESLDELESLTDGDDTSPDSTDFEAMLETQQATDASPKRALLRMHTVAVDDRTEPIGEFSSNEFLEGATGMQAVPDDIRTETADRREQVVPNPADARRWKYEYVDRDNAVTGRELSDPSVGPATLLGDELTDQQNIATPESHYDPEQQFLRSEDIEGASPADIADPSTETDVSAEDIDTDSYTTAFAEMAVLGITDLHEDSVTVTPEGETVITDTDDVGATRIDGDDVDHIASSGAAVAEELGLEVTEDSIKEEVDRLANEYDPSEVETRTVQRVHSRMGVAGTVSGLEKQAEATDDESWTPERAAEFVESVDEQKRQTVERAERVSSNIRRIQDGEVNTGSPGADSVTSDSDTIEQSVDSASGSDSSSDDDPTFDLLVPELAEHEEQLSEAIDDLEDTDADIPANQFVSEIEMRVAYEDESPEEAIDDVVDSYDGSGSDA